MSREEHHRIIVDLTSDYTYALEVDADGNTSIDWVTEGFRKTTGYTPAEVDQAGSELLVDPADLPILAERHRRLLSGKRDVSEYRIVTKEGRRRWLRDYAHPVWDDDLQRVVRIHGAAQDVTDRVAAERALRESEEMLRAIFEHAHDGISIYEELPETGSRRLLDCNDRYADLAGRSKAELLAIGNPKSFQRRIERARSLNENRLIREYGLPYRGVFSWIRPDGKDNVIEYTAAPVSLGGRPLTVGIDRDLTQRIRTEETLQTLTREWQTTFDAVTDGLCLLDAEQRIVQHNRAMAELFPDQLEDLVGRKCWEVVHGTKAPIEGCPLRRVATSRHRESIEIPFDDRVLEITIDPILDEAGELTGAVHLIRDVTKRKETEDILRNYTERLEEMVATRTQALRDAQERLVRRERLAAVGELAGGVGHELRTPLGVISNAIYYLRMVMPEDQQAGSEYLGIIEHEVNNASDIIRELLDYARIESTDRRPVEVASVVATTVNRHPLPENVTLALELSEDLPRINVDPRHIGQVLDNLITNASQAMPQGGQLTLSAQPCAPNPEDAGTAGEDLDCVQISVTDTGVGISPADMERLFEPLFTTKAKGIGLGLAICRKLVEANDGKITVSSKEGAGSTFTLLLPVDTAAP